MVSFVSLPRYWLARMFFILFILPVLCLAQPMQEIGKILDSIPVTKTSGETFALYLPTTFNPKSTHPILFIFDPVARGKVGIRPFISSSEKYGIILICSNNLKNGPYEKNFGIANNLFDHVFENYKVDTGQMFLTGFSGGSRLATAIATLSNQFAGVVGCGAGFSPNPSHIPSTQNFLYAGICGVEDMNYLEMLANDEYLSRLDFEHTVISFNGGHQWPPADQIDKAFDWMYLKIQRSNGSLKVDNAMKQQLEDRLNQVRSYKDGGEYLLASEHYKRLLETYPTALLSDSISSDYRALLDSKEHQAATKERNQVMSLEKKISQKFFNRLPSELENDKDLNWRWWTKEIERLDKLKSGGNKEEQQMVARIKYALMAYMYEQWVANSELKQNESIKNTFQRFRELLYPKKENALN